MCCMWNDVSKIRASEKATIEKQDWFGLWTRKISEVVGKSLAIPF